MAGFLKLNSSVPSVARPFLIEDLADIWAAFTLMVYTQGNTPRILSGMQFENGLLTSGAIYFNGVIYFHDAAALDIEEGDTIYGYIAATGDDRTYDDGVVRPFSTVAKISATAVEGSTVIGVVYASTMTEWATPFIGANTINNSMLANRAVDGRTILEDSVSTESLARQYKKVQRFDTITFDSNAEFNVIDIIRDEGRTLLIPDIVVNGADGGLLTINTSLPNSGQSYPNELNLLIDNTLDGTFSIQVKCSTDGYSELTHNVSFTKPYTVGVLSLVRVGSAYFVSGFSEMLRPT